MEVKLLRGAMADDVAGISGSGSGSGYGYGSGDGSGSGDGYGDGYGSGYGYGDGSGDGSGSGDGYGDGYGYGYGSGYGSGDGSGDGSGYGSGDGSGSGDGYGYGSGYGSGDGSGYGSGSGSGDKVALARQQIGQRYADDPRVIALWKSTKDATPANGGTAEPARPGLIQREPSPLRDECGAGQLHATLQPDEWQGDRLWVVALGGEVRSSGNKMWALEREILEEVVLGSTPSVTVR